VQLVRTSFIKYSLLRSSAGEKEINSVVLVRKRTISTERPQPAGEVSANFSW
jgi:hypothetical protein